jgi:molybdate transport system substrate-binding protein
VAANKALAAGNVRLTPSTQEPDVKAALTKLRLGEVDAALVYRTDTLAPTSRNVLEGVEFPESAKAVNDYPVVLLKRAPNYPTGLAFVNFLFGDFAQGKLSAAGFQSPGAPTVTTS